MERASGRLAEDIQSCVQVSRQMGKKGAPGALPAAGSHIDSMKTYATPEITF